MAATAHSDPYSVFLRRIGYSVGLERTLERFGDLQELYVESGDVTLASWSALVGPDTGWQLKTDNIADVFFSLGFIHRTPGDVLVLDNLDAAAIAANMLKDPHDIEVARSFIFLWAVLVNDGEIFVNILLSDFDEERIREKLGKLIKYKRDALATAMPGRDALKRIEHVVTIERQEKNRGSAGGGKTVASLKRTQPLEQNKRLESDVSIHGSIDLSEDYFRKVPPRRKDWARSLGLWEDGVGLTNRGRVFTQGLLADGYITDDDIFVFWPMDYELVRSGFKPNLIGSSKSLWQTLMEFGAAFADLRIKPFSTEDTENLVDQLRVMMRVYRSLHPRKAMLRREMAITVAYPSLVAMACAMKSAMIDVPKALDAERRGDKRRIVLRRSRNTGGALTVKR